MAKVRWPSKWERGDGVRSSEESNDRALWESTQRHEVRNYTYVFSMGMDEPIFGCDRCGSLVRNLDLGKHDHFHSLINVMLNSGAMA